MKKTKVLLTLACAVLLVAASVMGTMAYLTSNDSVTNTFTVGQVKITLDEAKVNGNGEPINKDGTVVTDPASAERVDSNSYKLMPGHSYTKDPTVTVLEGSEESYVRLLVTVNFENVLTNEQLATDLDGIFEDYDSKWIRNTKNVQNNVTVGTGNEAKTYGTVITYEYRYTTGTVAATTSDTKLEPLFKSVAIPKNWTNDDLKNIGGFIINIEGQAIQADGFGTADAAWGVFSK